MTNLVERRPTWNGNVIGWLVAWGGLGWVGASGAVGASLADAEALLRAGKYAECSKLVDGELANGAYHADPWYRCKIEADRARGDYGAAIATLEADLRRNPTVIPLRLLAREVYREAGRDAEAQANLDAIERLVQNAPSRFDTPEGRVALGRYFTIRGADARQVLDRFYDVAIKQKPELVAAYLATAELALSKGDNALAAATLSKAPPEAAQVAEYHSLLARSLADDDRPRSTAELAEAIKINPNHVDSLILQADARVDNEEYDDASRLLTQVLDIHPGEPRAWAYRAVLAHLRHDPDGEAKARTVALAQRPRNPEVDHIIGRELSRKYRFAEGSDHQKQALAIDPEYTPAQVQLCQDWLRLGREDEGWKLADTLFAADPYNVLAYNLVTLRDRLREFRTLRGDGILLKMDPREADLYGARALALLAKARTTLGEKYGVKIDEPVTVEVFPAKKEFAVRTFGLPGAEGFLGVCFGRVITANSPASQGANPSNWEAVLWHEYCHAVTLGKTKNKMPRWLSEGISVYEEGQANPAWRSATDPRFRAMLLGPELTPMSQLSSAFLAPKSGLHLQFAYHESAMAIDFLVGRFGLPALRSILDDLATGATINEALKTRTGQALDQLDEAFTAFAHAQAEAIAPGSTWEDVKLPPGDRAALVAFLKDHPANYPARRQLAAQLVRERRWDEAKAALAELEKLDPNDVAPGNLYELRAEIARQTSDPAGERTALAGWAARDGNAQSARLRLAEIDEGASDWAKLAEDARQLLAINPLIVAPHRWLAQASEKLDQKDEAVAEYRAWASLDTTDPAEIHFRLAKLLAASDQRPAAKREVLKALEAAPRFRDAHLLLLELVGQDPTKSTATHLPPTPELPR